jgi:hypothetical protein
MGLAMRARGSRFTGAVMGKLTTTIYTPLNSPAYHPPPAGVIHGRGREPGGGPAVGRPDGARVAGAHLCDPGARVCRWAGREGARRGSATGGERWGKAAIVPHASPPLSSRPHHRPHCLSPRPTHRRRRSARTPRRSTCWTRSTRRWTPRTAARWRHSSASRPPTPSRPASSSPPPSRRSCSRRATSGWRCRCTTRRVCDGGEGQGAGRGAGAGGAFVKRCERWSHFYPPRIHALPPHAAPARRCRA